MRFNSALKGLTTGSRSYFVLNWWGLQWSKYTWGRFIIFVIQLQKTAVAQWLRYCATNRKVAGSIPAGVIGFFFDIKNFLSHYGPGVDSASNRNEYQEYFLGVKPAGA